MRAENSAKKYIRDIEPSKRCPLLLFKDAVLKNGRSCEVHKRSIIVPNKTTKPNNERTMHVMIAPVVKFCCPLGGSFEHFKSCSVVLLLLKSVSIKEARDFRSQEDGTQMPSVMRSDVVFAFDCVGFGMIVPVIT